MSCGEAFSHTLTDLDRDIFRLRQAPKKQINRLMLCDIDNPNIQRCLLELKPRITCDKRCGWFSENAYKTLYNTTKRMAALLASGATYDDVRNIGEEECAQLIETDRAEEPEIGATPATDKDLISTTSEGVPLTEMDNLQKQGFDDFVPTSQAELTRMLKETMDGNPPREKPAAPSITPDNEDSDDSVYDIYSDDEDDREEGDPFIDEDV